jgi:hypothetical protein
MSENTPPRKPRRRHSGTAEWHMSKEAVSLSIVELLALSNDGALDLMIDMRWGGR